MTELAANLPPDRCNYDAFAMDAWSLGCILYEMLQGRLPYEVHYSWKAIQNYQSVMRLAHFYNPISSKAKLLIWKLLMRKPEKRPEMLDVLKDKWLEDVPPEATIKQ